MPFAVAHVLVPIIIISILRRHFKKWRKRITLHEIFIAGLFGLLPDLDVPVWWIYYYLYKTPTLEIHRVFSHTFVIPAAILLVALVFYYKSKQNKRYGKWYVMSLLAAGGFASHIILDYLLVGLVMPLWPISTIAVGLQLIPADANLGASMLAGIDAVLLLFWIWHEEHYKKIKAYF